MDPSSPGGASVNDGIDPHKFTLHYITVDQVIRMVSHLDRGALMAKFDLEAAYRNIPINPADRFLLGMKWRDSYYRYVDLTLPFGLRSAPYIFDAIADMVEWILVHSYQVSDLLHFLDDFITAGLPASTQCARNLSTALAVCDGLGLPLHPGKCVGSAPVLTILGTELDSVNQVAHLPAEKLEALRELIALWLARTLCNRRKLESLIGHLHHAAKVVWPGRTFLRRMIDLPCCFHKKDHPNKEFHHDLQWWHQFLIEWHGVSFWIFPGNTPAADVEVSSDVAGSLGFGTYVARQCFFGSWRSSQQEQSITYKELFPVVITARVWGHQWCRQHVLFRSDNDSVVHILLSRTSKPSLMHLLCALLLAAAHHSFSFSAQHIQGVPNSIADTLSRFHWQDFHRLAPEAYPHPTLIPPQLLEDLISPL